VKVGDLVMPKNRPENTPLVEEGWIGVVIGYNGDFIGCPVVYWSEEYSAETEYAEQLEVISESR
tara:strand:+ start:75 stop:266 length:192 start_codon:yes stop_codon:yes gene_type:complete